MQAIPFEGKDPYYHDVNAPLSLCIPARLLRLLKLHWVLWSPSRWVQYGLPAKNESVHKVSSELGHARDAWQVAGLPSSSTYMTPWTLNDTVFPVTEDIRLLITSKRSQSVPALSITSKVRPRVIWLTWSNTCISRWWWKGNVSVLIVASFLVASRSSPLILVREAKVNSTLTLNEL